MVEQVLMVERVGRKRKEEEELGLMELAVRDLWVEGERASVLVVVHLFLVALVQRWAAVEVGRDGWEYRVHHDAVVYYHVLPALLSHVVPEEVVFVP